MPLDICVSIFGFVVLHLLAVSLLEQGKTEECEQQLQRSLVMKKSALGEDNIELADSK